MAVPDDDEIRPWLDRARRAGASDDLLERTAAGGHTGVVATLSQGEGPCIGLRVDLDAISIHESAEPDHRPTAEGSARNTTGTCTPAATTRTSRSRSGR